MIQQDLDVDVFLRIAATSSHEALITIKIVLFHTLNTLGFENFLRSNQPNRPSWYVKDLTMLLINFVAVFVVFTGYLS